MKIGLDFGSPEAEIECFATALHRTFRGDPWADVLPIASEAWSSVQLDGRAWEEIADQIHEV